MSSGPHTDTAAEVLAHLERLGISQRQLAARLHVTETTVSRWANGHTRPDDRTRRAMQQLKRRVAVNANDLVSVLDAYESSVRDYLVDHEGTDYLWTEYASPAFKRLRAATTKEQTA